MALLRPAVKAAEPHPLSQDVLSELRWPWIRNRLTRSLSHWLFRARSNGDGELANQHGAAVRTALRDLTA